jgi:tagatose 6-phosphate kinase
MILITTLNPCIDKTIYIKKNFFGKIIKAEKVKSVAGGKGNNVARVLNGLGIKNVSLNFLGGHYGEIIKELLERDKINYEFVKIKDSSRSVITVLEDNFRQTAYVETSPGISSEEKKEMLHLFETNIIKNKNEIKLIIISGSAPSGNCMDIYEKMIEIAKDNGIMTILDSSGKALKAGINAKPFMIKPNLSELEDIFGKKFSFASNNLEEVLTLLKELNKKIEIIVLTLEKLGAIALINNKVYKIIVPKVKTINPVGSGDAFIAGFAYGFYQGIPYLDCLRIGAAAGAANAAMWDACFCSKDQIFYFIDKITTKEIN